MVHEVQDSGMVEPSRPDDEALMMPQMMTMSHSNNSVPSVVQQCNRVNSFVCFRAAHLPSSFSQSYASG
jgi:hypothetical protein